MIEQSGIYRVDLYENTGLRIIKDDTGLIDSIIVTSGAEYTVQEEDNKHISFEYSQQIGANNRLIFNYTIGFIEFGFEFPKKYNSVYGFIPVIYFRNGDIKLINNPIFWEDPINYTESNTQAYNIMLTNKRGAKTALVDFANVTPIWILETGIWNDDGIWMDNKTWID